MAGGDTCKQDGSPASQNSYILSTCLSNYYSALDKLDAVGNDLKEFCQVSCSSVWSCFHMFSQKDCGMAETKEKRRVDYGDNNTVRVLSSREIMDSHQQGELGHPDHAVHYFKPQNTAPIHKIGQSTCSHQSYGTAGVEREKLLASIDEDICLKFDKIPSDISKNVIQKRKEQNVSDDTNRKIIAEEMPIRMKTMEFSIFNDTETKLKDLDGVLSNNEVVTLRKIGEYESEGQRKMGNNSNALSENKTKVIEGSYQGEPGVKPDKGAALRTGASASGKNDGNLDGDQKYSTEKNEPKEGGSLNNSAAKIDAECAYIIKKKPRPADTGNVAQSSVDVQKCDKTKNTKLARRNMHSVRRLERKVNNTKTMRRLAADDVEDVSKLNSPNSFVIQIKLLTTEEYQTLVIETKELSFLLAIWLFLLNCRLVLLIDTFGLRWIMVLYLPREQTFVPSAFFNWIVLLFMFKLLTSPPKPHRSGNEVQKQNLDDGNILKEVYGKSSPKDECFHKMSLTKKSDNFREFEASTNLYKGTEIPVKKKKEFQKTVSSKCRLQKEIATLEHLLQFRDNLYFRSELICVPTVPWTSLDYYAFDSRTDPNFTRRDAMYIELVRLSTLGYLPPYVSRPSAQLSNDGLYFDRAFDEVVCYSCECRSPVRQLLEVEECLNSFHRSDCRHVTGTDYRNVPIPRCTPSQRPDELPVSTSEDVGRADVERSPCYDNELQIRGSSSRNQRSRRAENRRVEQSPCYDNELQTRGSSSRNQRSGRAENRREYASVLTMEESNHLQRENEELKNQITCKICLDKRVNLTFLPCGHLVCCDDCGRRYRRKHRRCFICGRDIQDVHNSFLQ